MAKIASSKQTGGGGFDFEDKVAAGFLTRMLCQITGFAQIPGVITKIAFQSRPEGWLLDDLLLTFTEGSQNHQVAVSAKSNRQITATGLPDGILLDVWKQFLGVDSNIFDVENDYLMFIVSPLGRSVSTNLSELIHRALETDPKVLAERIGTAAFSNQHRTLFKGFDCPKELKAIYPVNDEMVFLLLRRIIFVEFDYQSVHSKDYEYCQQTLQGKLRSQNGDEAARLFNHLGEIRKNIAKYGGDIDYSKLLRNVTGTFELHGIPVHAPDWNKIQRFTKAKLDNFSDQLGGSVKIDRNRDKGELNVIFEKTPFVFLTGKSGYGKSVLAKEMANDVIAAGNQVFWLDADALTQVSVETALQLRYTLEELLTILPGVGHLLIVDGADRFFKDTLFDVLAPVLRTVIQLGLPEWRIIVTCQTEDYDRLIRQFHRKNIVIADSKVFEISSVKQLDLLKVAIEFPQLVNLIRHDHLVKLFANLKLLDLVIFRLSSTNIDALENEIGESALIDWIWEEEILNSSDDGSLNSRFLQALAERQANEMSSFTSLTAFSVPESAPIGELKRQKFLREDHDRLYFSHDLYGDWARYKIVRSNSAAVKDFMLSLNLISPLWCKAIRVYGVYLLEMRDNAAQWLSLFLSFNFTEPKERLIRTLLLESIIFSNKTEDYLEVLWIEFKKDDGKILRHFFDQFLFRATAPNMAVVQLAGSIEGVTASQLATFHRTPIYSYWYPVLQFITSHDSEMIELVRGKCLEIAKIWLSSVPVGTLYHREMSKISLDIAKWMFEFKQEGGFAAESSGKKAYESFLYAVDEFPEEVADLALKLCRRKGFEKSQKQIEKQSYRPLMSRARSGTPAEKGPTERVDEDFLEVCLNTPAMHLMIKSNPVLAKEILLALLISEPVTDYFGDDSIQEYGLNEVNSWFPPFYNRGPFLQFLRLQPASGAELVIELCNLSIQKWLITHPAESNSGVNLIYLDGTSKMFHGDNQVYYWYRDNGNVPHCLVSALMALEKYLIDEVDQKRDISPIIELLLSQGRSVALLGILSSIGKYHPPLFLGVLKPLLGLYELYQWEMSLSFTSGIEGHQMMGAELFDSSNYELAKKWNSMPLRKTSLPSLAIYLNLTNTEIQEFFKSTVRPAWTQMKLNLENKRLIDPYLSNLLAQFDRKNYQSIKSGAQQGVVYQEPKVLTDELAEVRMQSEQSDFDLFSFKIYQKIDENKSFTALELTDIWKETNRYYALPEIENEYYNKKRHANVFAGLAAIILNRTLIEDTYPEYLTWAYDIVESAWDNYTLDYRNNLSSSTYQSWDNFSAIIVPSIYKHAPSDERIRKIIARMVLHAQQPVVELLFMNLGRLFAWYDPLFVPIQNLYIERCRLVHNLGITVWDSSAINFEELLKPALEQFIKDGFSTLLIDLNSLRAHDQPQRQKRKHQKEYAELRDPGFDVSAIYYAFSSMPLFSNDLDEPTKEYVLNFYQSVVSLLVYRWGSIDEERLQLDEHVTSFDRWVALVITQVLSVIDDESLTRPLWEPLFAYGNLNFRWLEEFTRQLLYNNMNRPQVEIIGKTWNGMIDYSFKTKTWGSDVRFRNRASLWHSLLGISSYGLQVWKSGQIPLITEIHKQLIRWFIKQVTNAEEINKLLILMVSPSAKIFLSSGLKIIALHLKYQQFIDNSETPDGYVRIAFAYNDEVAKMCSFVWENLKNEVTREDELFDCFKNIVVYLVAIQNPIGLELQGRLIAF